MTAAIARWFGAPEISPTATVDPTGARTAAHRAQLELENERQRTRQTTAVGESLRDLRERNHFADLIIASMEPRRT